MSSGYVIKVGHADPVEVIISSPNENHEPGPNAVKAIHAPGAFMLINSARVWARRVLNTGKLPEKDGVEEVLEVSDLRYTGKLEFLKWMDQKPGAQQIQIRYLPQSQTLDVEYQDNRQKVRLDPEGKNGEGFVQLDSGENKFDIKRDALLIEFLKAHPQNKNSICKNDNPSIKGYTYLEVDDKVVDKSVIVKAEAALTAGGFIKQLSEKEQSLRNLLSLIKDRGVDFGLVNALSIPSEVYKTLLVFAQEQPTAVNQCIDEYKKMISDCFVKAEAYKALDITKNGFIALLIENKSQIMFEVPEGKGRQMLDWVLANFLDSEVFDKTKEFKKLCDTKLK